MTPGRARNISHITVLANPAAGHGNGRHAATRAVTRFQQLGVDVNVIVGVDGSHALTLAREAVERGTDALVVVGGDGVISIALQVLAGTAVPLGIVAAGTGNDHAREFGLPTGDPEAAAEIVAAGFTESVDLGRIRSEDGTEHGTERWFGTVMASGFDSLVSDRTNRMRWPHGRMRYNLAIAAEFFNLKPLPFRLVLDGGEEIFADITLVAVGNTRSYGGGMLICPGADHTDGLLDITVVASGSRASLIRFFPTVFRGTHIALDQVTTYRAKSITVKSPGINAYADGERVGPLPVEVNAVPKALHVLVPR